MEVGICSQGSNRAASFQIGPSRQDPAGVTTHFGCLAASPAYLAGWTLFLVVTFRSNDLWDNFGSNVCDITNGDTIRFNVFSNY